MLIALAYSQASQDHAEVLLDWIGKLGPYPNHTLILAIESQVAPGLAVSDGLLSGFGKIERFSYVDHMNHFPESSNLAFQQCALYVASTFPNEPRWLYIEPDCVPLRASWLDEIEKEAQESGKPFVGPRVAASPTQRTPEHMAGVAVYPVNLIAYGAGDAMIATEQPWPAAIARKVLPQMAESKLICHDWEKKGVGESFAIYHPDRDGEILKNLSGDGVMPSNQMSCPESDGMCGPEVDSGGDNTLSSAQDNLKNLSAVSVLADASESNASGCESDHADSSGEARESTIKPRARLHAEKQDSHGGGQDNLEGGDATVGEGVIPLTSGAVKSDPEAAPGFFSETFPISEETKQMVQKYPFGKAFPADMGKTHSVPWENRLETEERIKWLVGELKTHCTKPAYTHYIRSVLAYYGVTIGRTRMDRRARRLVKKGLKGK